MDQPIVFVIDDDESICRSLRRLIQSVGLHVRTFTSGNDFLNQGCQNMSGCILLDVRMPDISGLGLQQRLNDSGCKIPIIFMSAHQDTETREKALNAGAIAFLQKPFEDQLLLETIRSALNGF
jgi:FixJ family two-component response regulator